MKKMLATVLVFSLVLSLFNFALVSNSVQANDADIGIQRLKLYPTANTYVNGYTTQRNNVFGTEAGLGVGNDREMYLKFDLSSIDIENLSLVEAKLNLYKTDTNTNTLGLSYVASDDWDNNISWNTRPAKGDQLTTFVASGQNKYITVDLAASVLNELTVVEDDELSIHIERLAGTYPNGFASTRAANEAQWPYLEIVTMSHSSIVAADKAELAEWDGKIVKSHLALPARGTLGSTITWSSDKPDVISETGRVQRPEAGTGNVDVVLTATVQMQNAVDTYQATVTVQERADRETYTLYPEADTYVHDFNPAVSYGTENGLGVGNGRETYLRFDLSDIAEEQETLVFVAANLNLYKTDTNSNTLGLFHVEANNWNNNINWNNRPAKGDQFTSFVASGQNRFVSVDLLPAMVNKLQSGNNKFSLNITRLSGTYPNGFSSTRAAQANHPYLEVVALTHEGAIEQEAEELLIRNGSKVYTDVELPTAGRYGSTISWQSSHPEIISTSGSVTRPVDQDVTVTLTATIQSGSVSKAFDLIYQVPKFAEITPQHPQIYADNADKAAIAAKIEANEWAQNSFNKIRSNIDSLVEKTLVEPDYVTSRMAMYWKDGERYTQTYVKGQNFDYGTGNAPVPTVRMPGMRTWNAYSNPPLEDRIPYSEDGAMYGVEKTNPSAPPVLIPYKETGHLVWGNNEEILNYAKNAAFVYWITGEEKYAKFAADIYWQWLLGTYYMNPPLDPDRSLGGPGGYAPGGISGYYDYEVIHDTLGGVAATIYDFLHGYLDEHADDYIDTNLNHDEEVLEKNVTKLSGIVFKRFIDIGFVRGNRDGNWNTNFWNSVMNAILALESNDYYADFKGKEYYLQYYTTYSTPYHQAIPEIMQSYDPVTGLWPESPGYAFGTINQILSNAIPIYRGGVDIIAGNAIVNKAALAPLAWLDARGLAIRLGDGSGGPLDYSTFERLATYYKLTGNSTKQNEFAAVIQSGIDGGFYNRNSVSFVDIIQNVETLPEATALPFYRTAYSEHHKHITMKNLNDAENGLMATLYGGTDGYHLHNNGLAMQLYGKGWALGPNTLSYESYWSADYRFSKEAVGSNTILPGYTKGPVTVNAIDPAPAPGELTNLGATSEYVQFSDLSAAEKRRQLSIIRTSPTTGYYVDIFRSDQINNDYIYRNLGDEMVVSDAAGQALNMTAASDLTGYPNYDTFTDAKKAGYTGDINVRWSINRTNPDIVMDMWMKGQDGRTVYAADSYKTSRTAHSSPQNIGSESTPTLVVRQNGNNGWTAPFISVFEPYEGDNKSIKSITDWGSTGNFAGIVIESNSLSPELAGRKEYVFSASDDAEYSPQENVKFSGMYGVASENESGFLYLYLGKGKQLQFGDYRLSSSNLTSANLENKTDGLYYTSTEEVSVTIPYTARGENTVYADLKLAYELNGQDVELTGTVVDEETQTLTAVLPAGSNVKLKVVGDVELEDLTITPESVALKVGAAQSLSVMANYTDGSEEDVTTSATYSTSNSVVATVSETGVVTAVAAGTATITVTFESKSKPVVVTVTVNQQSYPGTSQTNKTSLIAAIQTANDLLEKAVIGTTAGDYPEHAVSNLKTVLEQAQQINNNALAGQSEVNAAVSKLNEAIRKLQDSIIKEEDELDQEEPETKNTFSDVANHWAKEAIQEAVVRGFVNGYTDGSFRPDSTITRAEFATILVRALKLPFGNSEKHAFTDSIPVWAEDYVQAAVSAGLFVGFDDGSFGANKPITRQQMAVIIARALHLDVNADTNATFEDRESIAPWALSSVSALAELGILVGNGNNQFDPNANTTRAAAITVFLRLLEQLQ